MEENKIVNGIVGDVIAELPNSQLDPLTLTILLTIVSNVVSFFIRRLLAWWARPVRTLLLRRKVRRELQGYPDRVRILEDRIVDAVQNSKLLSSLERDLNP